MIFFIEGADGSGKTTLANQIAKQTGYQIIHKSQPKTDEEKARMFDDYAKELKAGKNLIFDRCFYSEMAYGPTMRDKSEISYPDMYELERLAAKQGGLIIFCTDKPETLWKRCKKRGEDYILNYIDFVDICEAFDEIMNVPHFIPVVRYAYKDV